MTSTTKTATTREGCAYIYRQPKLTRCSKTREEHDRVRGLSHDFVGVDAPEHDADLRDDDDGLITFDVHAYKTEQDFEQCRPTTVIDSIVGCDDANKEARRWLSDHAVVKVQSSDRETIDVLRNDQAAQSDTGQPEREVPLLDFHIADNAEQPAILLTRAGDGLTLGVFPVEYEELVVKIVHRVNSHESLIAALEQSRETINELTWNRHIVGRTREKLSRVSEQCAEALKHAQEGERGK